MDTRNLRSDIDRCEKELQDLKQKLTQSERTCHHDWSPVTPDHIYHKAYTIPGDPPGVGGSDHQFPCHVDAKTEHRWKRTCSRCGKVEYTSRTQDKIEKIPVF